MQPYRKVVLGIGNILNRDEGLGIEAVQRLENGLGPRTLPAVEFIDGGVLGMDLLPLVESCTHLLVLDAIDAGKTPGALIEIPGEDIPLFTKVKMSEHQVTFQELLGLAQFRGTLPEHLHLIGTQPADIALGLGISETIERRMPGVMRAAKQVLDHWELLRTQKNAAKTRRTQRTEL